MKVPRLPLPVLPALVASALVACAVDESPRPRSVGDAGVHADWLTDDPALHGFDRAGLAAVREWAFDRSFHTQSVLIVSDGVLIAEWYADGVTPGAWATSWSSAKSIAATLVGTAVATGAIAGLDVTMPTWFPAWTTAGLGDIRLRDVLHMQTGFAWTESPGLEDDLTQMSFSFDQLAYVEGQTLADPPGTTFYYSSGTSMLLSRVLRSATGREAHRYLVDALTGPLRFGPHEWWRDGAGHTLTYCCLNATARDFAKIGQLYLQDGVWDGRRLLPEGWVDQVQADDSVEPSYSLHFWRNRPGGIRDFPGVPYDTYFAQGHDGQHIAIIPSQRLVVTRHALFKRPPGPPEAPEGVFGAGMFLEGFGPTGTRAPGSRWSLGEFLRRILEARRG